MYISGWNITKTTDSRVWVEKKFDSRLQMKYDTALVYLYGQKFCEKRWEKNNCEFYDVTWFHSILL